jgi:flavodoxin
MKKTLAIIVSLAAVAFSFAGCGQSINSDSTAVGGTSSIAENSETESSETENMQTEESIDETTSEDTSEENTNEITEENTDTSDVLVVYYSAQEHTKGVAEIVAETLDADVFVITPAEVYTEDDLDWTNENSRVVLEHEDENRHTELVSTEVDGWESYETVLIGYPIWWQEAAWVVDDFVKENDFSGKTVIPFCTSTSSGIGESGNLLAQMAGSGEWLDGMRFSENYDSDEVATWAEGLGV